MSFSESPFTDNNNNYPLDQSAETNDSIESTTNIKSKEVIPETIQTEKKQKLPKLGLWSRFQGFRSIEEKNIYNKIKQNIQKKKIDEATNTIKKAEQDFPDSKKIKKLSKQIQTLQKKAEQKDTNVFTEVFDEKKSEKNIIDNIVNQQHEEKNIFPKDKNLNAQNSSFLTQKTTPELINNEENLPKSSINFSKIVGTLLIIVCLIAYGYLYIENDPQNNILTIAKIENTGKKLFNLEKKQSQIQNDIKIIQQEISNLKNNTEAKQLRSKLEKIIKERIVWSDLLKEIQQVTSQTPTLQVNGLSYYNYTGNAKTQTMTISGEVQHERMFTLIANLVDTINKHPRFYDFIHRNFSKGSINKESTKYKQGVSISFKFLTDSELDNKKTTK